MLVFLLASQRIESFIALRLAQSNKSGFVFGGHEKRG